MRHLLLVVLFLAPVGPTSVIGQDQPTFVGEDQRRLLLTLAADPSDVAGQELSTGNELLARCQQALGEQPGPRDVAAASGCRALVRSVLAMASLTRSLRLCSPGDVTVIQAVRVVVNYLNAHPDELYQRDTTLTLRALRRAFPC